MSSAKQNARIKNKRRFGDPWVSKNRVLNPNKSKRNCPIYRNPNFDTDETKLLIQLWGDPKVQRELITTHKKHLVIAQLASKMEEYGYCRSPEEITTRIKNMKCFYNRLKKEMEINANLDPSWRHFADMEAIMTRPIFSVRPNEVPAPSFRYLLEQEEEKRKERKRKAEEEGIDISDSDDDIDDVLAVARSNGSERSEDECIIPDADIEFECDDITLAAIANGATNKCDKSNKEAENKSKNPDDELLIKVEIESEEFQDVDQNNKVQSKTKQPNTDHTKNNDNELLIPKIEPIDVDDPTQNTNDNKTPTKPAIISAPSLIEILNQPKNTPTMATSIAIGNFSMPQGSCYTNTTTAMSSSSPMVVSSTSTPSKISVVSPTILMPQANQLASADKSSHSTLPMRIGGNLQAFLTSPGARPTMTAANGMKFILVNTGDQRRPPSTMGAPTVTMASAALNPNSANVNINQSLQSSQNIANQTQSRTTQRSIQSPAIKMNSNVKILPRKLATDQPSENGDFIRKKELSGIKSTLVRLLKTHEDGNEVQSQRLIIERERLQHERTLAEKYLAIFEQNQKFQQQLLQQQQQILQMQQQLLQVAQQRPTTTQQLFATKPNTATTGMQNSGQLMLPPKLLITTMVPTSVANASAAANATLAPKVVTTANFQNLKNIGSTSGDKPLLIPKEEPDN